MNFKIWISSGLFKNIYARKKWFEKYG